MPLRAEKVALELGATCLTCDFSARRVRGKEGKAWCNRWDKIVSTNAVCVEYNKLGEGLAKLYARRVVERKRVEQTELFE